MAQGDNWHKSNTIVARRSLRYQTFWGRKPDLILHPTESLRPHIDIYRFPPIKANWFFQKWFKPVKHQYVYISGGMSDAQIPATEYRTDIPRRIELTTFSNEVYKNRSGDMDMIAWWLSFLVYAPYKDGNIFFAPGHTFSAPEPIIPGSEMTGFFFCITPSVALKHLRAASVNAELMLHIVPISESERKLVEKKGSEVLINYFDKYGIQPIFDLRRKPVI